MIKVLQIVSSLGSGGVESMLYNYYSYIDRSRIHFDFVVHGNTVGMLEERMQGLGSKVFHVTPKKKSFLKNMLEMNKIIKNGKYDVIHCHQNFSNFSPLFLARQNHIPVRICHAHGCRQAKGVKEKIGNHFFRLLNIINANYFFSCAMEAGRWLYGKNWHTGEKNIIMHNAIDINKFSYHVKVRKKYRNIFKIEDKIVLLHVGRFSDEKNQFFMINILERLMIQSDQYVLLFAGDGAMKKNVEKQARRRGLNHRVLFLGARNDVSELMSAADIFLLPSKHEGFPVTLIEAQAAGLTIFTSDAVTKETAVTDLIEYLPINNIDLWVKKILQFNITGRKSRIFDIENAGYSIDKRANDYAEWLELACSLE